MLRVELGLVANGAPGRGRGPGDGRRSGRDLPVEEGERNELGLELI